MAFKFKDIREDNGKINPIARRTTTYTPMITRKSALYRKDVSLSSSNKMVSEISKRNMENGQSNQEITPKPKRTSDVSINEKQINIQTNKKRFYTVKDILFGLRKELIKCNNELQVLEQYITYNQKKISDVEFLVSDNKQLFCKLTRKRNYLSKLIEYFCGAPYNGVLCNEGSLGIYDFVPNEFELKLEDDYVSEFNRQVRAIMNLPIPASLTEYTFGTRDAVVKSKDYRSMFIHETSNNLSFKRTDGMINYAPQQDIITHTLYKGRIGNSLENMLELEVPKDIFSLTEQEIIESSSVFDKGIRIICDNQDRVTDLQIFEDDKEYVLRKVKK